MTAVLRAVPAMLVFLGVLTVPLGAAGALGLSPTQLSSWIVTLYGLPGILGIALAIRYRQPIVLTGNVLAIILFASLAGQVPYAELVGASLAAGIVVALIGVLGLSAPLARLIPAPIVLGLLAGAVAPFVVRTFAVLDEAPLVVGAALVAYVAGRRVLGGHPPAVLPAVVAGLVAAALAGDLGPPPAIEPPALAITPPAFSPAALLGVAPVIVALMTFQANVPATIFLRSQGFDPPERTIDVVSGLGTAVIAVLGPTAVSMPLPIAPVVAGPEAGPREGRHRVALAAGGALVAIALLSGLAVALPGFIASSLILAFAGIALFGVLVSSLAQVARSQLLLGPLVAFVIAQSPLSLLGLGPFFWALAGGLAVSLVLERSAMRATA